MHPWVCCAPCELAKGRQRSKVALTQRALLHRGLQLTPCSFGPCMGSAGPVPALAGDAALQACAHRLAQSPPHAAQTPVWLRNPIKAALAAPMPLVALPWALPRMAEPKQRWSSTRRATAGAGVGFAQQGNCWCLAAQAYTYHLNSNPTSRMSRVCCDNLFPPGTPWMVQCSADVFLTAGLKS